MKRMKEDTCLASIARLNRLHHFLFFLCTLPSGKAQAKQSKNTAFCYGTSLSRSSVCRIDDTDRIGTWVRLIRRGMMARSQVERLININDE